ncbi:MAG TPA: hypothetical protein DCS97_15295, partial [Planctomycetes bacterium]|nr:hypothetical protein [Planctomycetota bacterium]
MPDNGSATGTSRLDYAVDIRTPGLYRIWLRVSQPNTAGNSLRYAVSTCGSVSRYDNFLTTIDDGTQLANSWRWMSVNDLRSLRSGLHRFSIQRNEDGFAVDRIVFTTDLGYDPSSENAGQGPDSTSVDPNQPSVAVGSLSFSSATYTQAEGNSGSATATITVTRTGGSSGAVGVSYATSNGMATSGSDYTAASGTLSWADGETASKTFTVAVLGDTAVEGDETVNLALSSATGGATLGTSAAT